VNFVLIFGPQAVGKMTVGQHLAEKLGYKLFHNHVTIDFLTPHFEFGTPSFNRLCALLRDEMLKEAIESGFPGVVATVVWAFNHPSDKAMADKWMEIVGAKKGKVCFVELETDLETRRERNKTENRRLHKPGNVARTEATIDAWARDLVQNTKGDFYYPDRHLKINNTHLGPAETADRIIQHFELA
jgi:hypothetical protein